MSPSDLRCMALVESHNFAYEFEAFAYNLRDYLIGLNLGRWDYMASLIHYSIEDPAWILPDRNTIPVDVPFFQALRGRIPEICHAHGMLAIGGMTALFPDRNNAELNARAMAALERDKKNEASFLFDGAWTGHPDQNAIAVAQFPAPNQITKRSAGAQREPDLRPPITGIGTRSIEGTRTAVRTVIRYRHGYLLGRGASLIDGFMEDLATDRIYRLMIAQRVKHGMHTAAEISTLFDAELAALCAADPGETERLTLARRQSEAMIVHGFHDPI
jgi:malate synthase